MLAELYPVWPEYSSEPSPGAELGRGSLDCDRDDRPQCDSRLLLMTSSWVRKHQQAVIDFMFEENRILLEQRNGKRLVVTDDQRHRLAVKGKVIGRRGVKQAATVVKADKVLAWHRKLIEQRCSAPERRPGRPRVSPEVRNLVLGWR